MKKHIKHLEFLILSKSLFSCAPVQYELRGLALAVVSTDAEHMLAQGSL